MCFGRSDVKDLSADVMTTLLPVLFHSHIQCIWMSQPGADFITQYQFTDSKQRASQALAMVKTATQQYILNFPWLKTAFREWITIHVVNVWFTKTKPKPKTNI